MVWLISREPRSAIIEVRTSMRSPLHDQRAGSGRERCVPMSACATLLLIVPLMGCTLGASRQAAVPPPPKPAAVQPPAPDPPLSIPQTAVTLPSPQWLNPDAIPKVEIAQVSPAPEKTEAPPAPRASHRTATGPAKPDVDPEPEAPAPPTPAVQEHAPPIQPILSVDEQKRIQRAIEVRKREIDDKLGRVKGHSSSHDKSLVERINSFMLQVAQAAQRGDYSQADALSQFALILSRELQVE